MLWSFGNAPEGTFSTQLFPSTNSTTTVKNLNIDDVFASWFFEYPTTITEYWNVLPL